MKVRKNSQHQTSLRPNDVMMSWCTLVCDLQNTHTDHAGVAARYIKARVCLCVCVTGLVARTMS